MAISKNMLVSLTIVLLAWQVAVADNIRDSLLIAKGQEAVRAALKDPNSAQFRQTYLSKIENGTAVVCGEVNSKNSYGGYAGFQRFISSGLTASTFLENDPRLSGSAFQEAWGSLCNMNR